jgi:hypothetical protein
MSSPGARSESGRLLAARPAQRLSPVDRVSPSDILELRGKYEEMLRMRLFDESHPGGDPRREMAALASRFPGALRELDEAPLERIRSRLAALSECVDTGEPPEPWMCATALFHRLTRGALAAKRWLGGRKDPDVIAGVLSWLEGFPEADDARVWADDLALVACPPRGKLSELVFERVATALNQTVPEVRTLIVGPTRSDREQ